MNKVLSINNISKTYYTLNKEIPAIKNISLDIYKNDFIALVGPSGCGKTTLLSIINNQDIPNTGGITTYSNCIGYMLQEDALFEWLNVLDNCLLGLKITNKLNTDNKKYVLNLIHKYGLEEFIYSYPNSLSGGMRQRVSLIRALSLKPDILLMDEPFSALDYQSKINISNDIYNILKKENKTLILVTHDITEAINMCNKIVILSKRPATIKNIYNITFDKSISQKDKRYTKEFNDYYNKIWKEIEYE
jgi:NitT/TauT family transport system ATP-binding protein